jgi:hypothetical protein
MDGYKNTRNHLLYNNTDLFLFCIATEYAHSLEDLMVYWIPEIELRPDKKPTARTILMCLNDHVRNDAEALKTVPNQWGQKDRITALQSLSISSSKSTGNNVHGLKFVDHEKAEKVAKEMGALKYIVCKGTSSNEDIQAMVKEVSLHLMSNLDCVSLT